MDMRVNSDTPPAGTESAPPARPPVVARLLSRGLQAYVMVGVLIVLALMFNLLTDGVALSGRNVSLLLRQSAILATVASGMVVLLVAREIDLSVGSSVALVGITAAMLQVQQGVGIVPTVLLCLAVGLAIGVWQGVWTAKLGVPSFVVTLVGLLVWRGLGFTWTDAATISPVQPGFVWLSEGFISPLVSVVLLGGLLAAWLGFSLRSRLSWQRQGLPVSSLSGFITRAALVSVLIGFFTWSVATHRGLPMAVAVAGTVALVLSAILRFTIFGRSLYAIGGNREAARLAGVNVSRMILKAFILMGFIYGVAGVLITARLNGAPPNTALFLELDAIAAAVIGGASLSGGVGTVVGALLGALLLSTLDNGMSLMNVSSFLQMMVKGFVLLIAVWLDVLSRRYSS